MKKNTEEIDFAIDFSLSALDLAYMLAYTILQRNPILSHIIPLYFLYFLSKTIQSMLPISSLNSQSGGTAMAQLNLSRIVLEKTFSIGTSFLLHHATEIRGSM